VSLWGVAVIGLFVAIAAATVFGKPAQRHTILTVAGVRNAAGERTDRAPDATVVSFRNRKQPSR
jgi:hypothetical protein